MALCTCVQAFFITFARRAFSTECFACIEKVIMTQLVKTNPLTTGAIC